jgi:hypothetical protein
VNDAERDVRERVDCRRRERCGREEQVLVAFEPKGKVERGLREMISLLYGSGLARKGGNIYIIYFEKVFMPIDYRFEAKLFSI